jgi:hypothetical protein
MKLKSLLQDTPVWLYLFVIAVFVGATVYQTLVILPEFTREMPASMIVFANGHIKPSNFWASPIFGLGILVVPILAIVVNWKTQRRKWLVLSFCFVIAASVFTTTYFYPRLRIMGLLGEPPTTDLNLLALTIKEWVFMDKLRFWLIVVPAFFMAVKAATVSTARQTEKVVEEMAPARVSHAAAV